MNLLNPSDITLILLSLGVLLALARLLGEIATWFHQPAVLGELLAGIILGPTILGALAPGLQSALFPVEGAVALSLEAIVTLAVVLFLLVAGMEVDLSIAFRQGKTALSVAFLGMAIPFALGFVAAWYFPTAFLVDEPEKRVVFALFMATALSISALPVIVKILKDLNLIKSHIGVIVVASAIINDLAGWIVFATVLGMMGAAKGNLSLFQVILLTLVFVVLMLTVVRWLVNKALPWIQAHVSWPAGVLGFATAMGLIAAAATEWIGIHAIFGAFLFGVCLGDSRHLRQSTRETLDHFISTIFAPIFFASIGLKVNFFANFALLPVVLVFVLALVGKMSGCWIGGRIAGLPSREALAIGAAKNARGAMEIILGLLALQYAVIDSQVFVALVIMALLTSMMSGTLVQSILRVRADQPFYSYLSTDRFVSPIEANTPRDCIAELAKVAAKSTGLDARIIANHVLSRERVMPTDRKSVV